MLLCHCVLLCFSKFLPVHVSQLFPMHLTVHVCVCERLFVPYVFLLLQGLPCPQRGPIITPRPQHPQQCAALKPLWLPRLKTTTKVSVIPCSVNPYPDVVWSKSCYFTAYMTHKLHPGEKTLHLSTGKRNDMARSVQSVVALNILVVLALTQKVWLEMKLTTMRIKWKL